MGYFQQDGNAVQRFAIRKTTDSLRMLKASLNESGVDLKFVGHQANSGMLATVCEIKHLIFFDSHTFLYLK